MSDSNEKMTADSDSQNAILGNIRELRITGEGTEGQVMAKDHGDGVKWVDQTKDVDVIHWRGALGDPTKRYGRLQSSGKFVEGLDSPGSNTLNKGVRLNWNYSNSTGTLSWWYPLKTSDHFTVTVTHRMTKATVEGKMYPQGDGITMYAGSSVDGFWKTNDNASFAVTCDEWGTDAEKYFYSIGNSPRSVVWLHNYDSSTQKSSLECVPPAQWNLYDTNTEKTFWKWTTTQMTWNPNTYSLEVYQNGSFLVSKKVDAPLIRGGWVGVHGYCGSNMATHDIREFRLTIHNNPSASPVGPYPKGEENNVVIEPGFQGTQSTLISSTTTSSKTTPWWKF